MNNYLEKALRDSRAERDAVCEGKNCKIGPLSFVEFQVMTSETTKYDNRFVVVYPLFGLVSKAGDMAQNIQAILLAHGGDMGLPHKVAVAKQIGEVLRYCACIATDMGMSLEEIAQQNINTSFAGGR